jgi:dienelactone hydrolase
MSRSRAASRAALVAAAIAVVLLLGACGSEQVVVGTPALTSAEVLAPGPFPVGVTTMNFTDASRPTMSNGTFPGAPTRSLVTEVWYPAAGGAGVAGQETRDAPLAGMEEPYPLIVYSHGFLSTRLGGAYLARGLASRGYVVAAPDFPLTNINAPGGPNLDDVVEQPNDVRFLIDRLLILSDTPGSLLSGGIDADRIGLVGLSLGAMTTMLATYHPALRDPRVQAAAVLAGPGCIFTAAFYGNRRVPLLLVHGDIDAIVPYAENAVLAYQEAPPPKYLLTLVGGSHTGFADGSQFLDSATNLDDIGCAALAAATGENSGWSTDFLERLGGAAAGVVAGDCPYGCVGPLPPSIRGTRQQELATLGVVPFMEAALRHDGRARNFLEHVLPAENAEARLQLTR